MKVVDAVGNPFINLKSLKEKKNESEFWNSEISASLKYVFIEWCCYITLSSRRYNVAIWIQQSRRKVDRSFLIF